MKVFIVGNMYNYMQWIENVELTDNLEEADIVMFTGGEDVDPRYYNAKQHKSTFCNPYRDACEIDIFKKIQQMENKPLCIGICRGSQMLTVCNGGKLIQNVTNHGIWGTHPIYFPKSKEIFEITSTHHQMMYPFDLPLSDYEILAHSKNKLSTVYEGDLIKEPDVEPEIVYYPKTKCLCIQGHPEMMIYNAPIIKKLNDLIKNYLKDE